MNVYDSQRMSDALAADGYAATETIEDADLVLLNTCHIREKAAEKVYSELGRIRDLKAEREQARAARLMIGVAGCVAQAEGAEIMRRAPAVDLVIGPQTYHRLPEALRRVARRREGRRDRLCGRGQVRASAAARRSAEIAQRGVTAFLTVQEGCDKFCTFCVVPYTRGSEVSRPVAQIVAEAERLADGRRARDHAARPERQCLARRGRRTAREWGLGRLLFRLAEIPGLARLRYTTSHPRDMDDELIAAHRDLPALMPYLHLPVQSGSDRILKAMNRRHTAADYLRAGRPHPRGAARHRPVGRFHRRLSRRDRRGFRGDAANWCGAVGYAQAFSFKYSPRPGTPGADMAGHVAEAVKDERLQRLQALLLEQQHAFRCEPASARTIDVLIEKPGRRPGQRSAARPGCSR